MDTPKKTSPSTASDRLAALAQAWESVPFVEPVMQAAAKLLAESSEQDFRGLVFSTTRALCEARGDIEPCERVIYGRGVGWLESLGVLADLQVALAEGDPTAPELIILSLRDGCLAELEHHHHRHRLACEALSWTQRLALSGAWLSPQQPTNRAAWELTPCIDALVEEVGATKRLMAQLCRRENLDGDHKQWPHTA